MWRTPMGSARQATWQGGSQKVAFDFFTLRHIAGPQIYGHDGILPIPKYLTRAMRLRTQNVRDIQWVFVAVQNLLLQLVLKLL